MLNKIKENFKKYEEIIMYLIIGGLTTVISLGIKYLLLFTVLDAKNPLELQLSVILSWIGAVIFAYFTNRSLVFKSKNKNKISEVLKFFGSRVVTLLMESVILWFFINFLKMNSDLFVLIWTLVTQVLIVIGNYVLSKFFVFKGEGKGFDFNKLKSDKVVYLLIFISFLILCYFFPYTHDDWDWGSYMGIDRLKTLFENYNGRWAGNIIVLFLTRSNILKTFVMASCLTGMIYFVNNIIKTDKKITIFLSYFLLLATPYLMLRESIVWTAGFTNYALSLYFVLLFIQLNKNIFEDKELNISNKFIPLFCILGFITTLFMEHITIYIVLLSIFIIGYVYKKMKKVYGVQISYFIGVISGTILMFSNSAYRTIASGDDFYRTMDSNILTSAINSYFNTISKELIFNNHILNIVLSVLILAVLYKVLKNKREKKSLKKLANFILYVVVSFPLYSCVTRMMDVQILLKYTKYFDGIFTFVYGVSILLFVIYFINDKLRKRRMIFTLVSIIILTLPLFVVTPVSSRCFLSMYILFIMFVIDLLSYILNNKKTLQIELFISKIIICLCCVFYIYLFGIFGYIFKTNMTRINYINENLDKEELVLPRLPYQKYLHVSEPWREYFQERFKDFHKIDRNTEIKFLNIKDWKKYINS